MKLTKKKVIGLAEGALALHQPRSYHMTVVKDQVSKVYDIWHVGVAASKENVRSYDFNARLAEAAVDLMDQHDVYIQFYRFDSEHAHSQ